MTVSTARLIAATVGVCLIWACGGATKHPTLPAPEFEQPVLPPWDAGVAPNPDPLPSSKPESEIPERAAPAEADPEPNPAPGALDAGA